jgi:hypothetical protein
MQIINEKPQIDLVSKAHSGAIRQEIEQKDRYKQAEIHNPLSEFEKVNFETQKSEIKNFILFTTSTLSGNMCKVENSGLNLLQTAEKDSLNINLELTETGFQVVTDWANEFCFCPVVRKDWNYGQ